MKTYTGTKVIKAKPMTRKDYNDFRGWVLPEDENGDDEGYLVEYVDGGKANTDEYSGYVSWSPRDVFERAYHEVSPELHSNLTFSQALEFVKRGAKAVRSGWNGKGMFIFLVQGSQFKVNRKPLLGIYPEGTEISYHAHIDMRTADGQIVPWLCSQSDMLANDWAIID